MAKDPPRKYFNKRGRGSANDDELGTSSNDASNKDSFTNDDEIYLKRYPKKHLPQLKFFKRDENTVYEDDQEDSHLNDTAFPSNGKTDTVSEDFSLKKYPKRPPSEQKFFIREENIVYENLQEESSPSDAPFLSKNNGENPSNKASYNYTELNEIEISSFSPESYDLFNYAREVSTSDETSSDDLEDEEDEEDEESSDEELDQGGCDADDEGDPEDFNADDIDVGSCETFPISSGTNVEPRGPNEDDPFIFPGKVSLEENRPLFAELLKRPKRVFPKRMKQNPEKAARPVEPKEDMWKGTPLEKDLGVKMPPEPPDDNWYPKPGDPEYIENMPVEPGTPWKHWMKQLPSFFPEDNESDEPGSSENTDYITDSSGFFSTETYIDSDELSTCPEDEPLYPYISKEAYMKPKVYEVENEFQRMPEGNPEVRTWFDTKAREWLDVKNDKGEWETVEQVIVQYPPVPKHPGRWERKPSDKPDENVENKCTCNEFDFTGFYDKHSRFQRPKAQEWDEPELNLDPESTVSGNNDQDDMFGTNQDQTDYRSSQNCGTSVESVERAGSTKEEVGQKLRMNSSTEERDNANSHRDFGGGIYLSNDNPVEPKQHKPSNDLGNNEHSSDSEGSSGNNDDQEDVPNEDRNMVNSPARVGMKNNNIQNHHLNKNQMKNSSKELTNACTENISEHKNYIGNEAGHNNIATKCIHSDSNKDQKKKRTISVTFDHKLLHISNRKHGTRKKSDDFKTTENNLDKYYRSYTDKTRFQSPLSNISIKPKSTLIKPRGRKYTLPVDSKTFTDFKNPITTQHYLKAIERIVQTPLMNQT